MHSLLRTSTHLLKSVVTVLRGALAFQGTRENAVPKAPRTRAFPPPGPGDVARGGKEVEVNSATGERRLQGLTKAEAEELLE